ncbi:MAG: hypothetical protein OXI63_01880 [Candidatus Poribacteria bacterium]|nr:hypothetical protein [Candidatus Poribacteria bacterium]
MTHTEARNLKAQQIRLCRHYLTVAKKTLGLSPESTTVRYWTDTLETWRATPITEIAARSQKQRK